MQKKIQGEKQARNSRNMAIKNEKKQLAKKKARTSRKSCKI